MRSVAREEKRKSRAALYALEDSPGSPAAEQVGICRAWLREFARRSDVRRHVAGLKHDVENWRAATHGRGAGYRYISRAAFLEAATSEGYEWDPEHETLNLNADDFERWEEDWQRSQARERERAERSRWLATPEGRHVTAHLAKAIKAALRHEQRRAADSREARRALGAVSLAVRARRQTVLHDHDHVPLATVRRARLGKHSVVRRAARKGAFK